MGLGEQEAGFAAQVPLESKILDQAVWATDLQHRAK